MRSEDATEEAEAVRLAGAVDDEHRGRAGARNRLRRSSLFALLLACGSTTPAPAPSPRFVGTAEVDEPRTPAESREPTALESGVIQRLVADAERIRRLTFLTPVDVEIQSGEEIAAHLDGEIEDADVDKARLLYGALGLVPDDIDMRELLRSVMGEQVLGYYDTDAKQLVLRDEIVRHLLSPPSTARARDARIIVVHELVHALQDQRLGLGRIYDRESDSDADLALRALVEGDATFAMLVYGVELAGGSLEDLVSSGRLDEVVSTLAAPPNDGDALGRAPAILRHTLVVPYLAGLGFVRRLHARGGWTAVDRAFAELPSSSEQVIHPRLYERREDPDALQLPELPELEAAGLTPIEEDTLGEIELAVFLGRGTAREVDRNAAEGWGGDRLRLYRRPDGLGAVVWVTTWDDESQAIEAEAAARRGDHDEGQIDRLGRAVIFQRRIPPEARANVLSAVERSLATLPARPPRRPSTVAP